MDKIDFKLVAENLLNNSRYLVPHWLPGGKLIGSEWVCGDKYGGSGKSMKVNLDTGRWCDFATSDKGGDLLALYKYIKDFKKMIEAVSDLEQSGDQSNSVNIRKQTSTKSSVKKQNSRTQDHKIIKPPFGQQPPEFKSKTVYTYKDIDGYTMFYIERADYTEDGKKKKTFRPWCFTQENVWINKQWPSDRPLYNLHKLKNCSKPVLIVEGEKCVPYAEKIVGDRYKVVTSVGGSSAWSKTDWSPLKWKHILIWPDADEPGIKYAKNIAEKLMKIGVDSCKIIGTDALPKGFDAADVGDMSWWEFTSWCHARVVDLSKSPPILVDEVPDHIKELVPIENEEYAPLATPVEDKQSPLDVIKEQWGKLKLIRDKKGNPYPHEANIARALERHKDFKGLIWYDDFLHEIMINRPDEDGSRPIKDNDYTYLLIYFQDNLGLKDLRIATLIRAINHYAEKNRKCEVREWLRDTKWDGTPRVCNFFKHYYGAEDTVYTSSVSKNFWVSMCARIIQPGCKVDNMVILEGVQGLYKSTSLRAIAGDRYYTEGHDDIGGKDFIRSMHGCIIYEIAELSSFSKSDVNKIKKIVSTATDKVRVPYGKNHEVYPRTSIMVGTTNDSDYLRDATGNRRFWPVHCNKILLDEIKADREQLFAEAYHLLISGESWHEMPLEETLAMQDSRREMDTWEPDIMRFVCDNELSIVNIPLIIERCLKIPVDRRDRRTSFRVSACLRSMGYMPTGYVNNVNFGGSKEHGLLVTRYRGKGFFWPEGKNPPWKVD